MTQITVAYDGALAVLRQKNGRWVPEFALTGKDCQCLAADPHRDGRLYCGTFQEGLWFSDDAGASWRPSPTALDHPAVMSVAVSPLETDGKHGVVWAGTEPSALYRSEDGGDTWQECSALQDLPSKPSWSFPPRPWTHHVRWVEPDANDADRIFAGIELGGVMRSLDRGKTWEDRKPGSQHDCHTLRTHPLAPGAVYEAAGGGFAESHDGGDTWSGMDEGLRHHYLWGLAADPANPDILVLSASPGARAAHDDQQAQAQLHRRAGDGPWQPLQEGLPSPDGTRAYTLATNRIEPGTFYAATRQNIFRSVDAGLTWRQLDVAWPDNTVLTNVNAMVVTSER